MKPARALARIRRLAREGRLEITHYAELKMIERSVAPWDLAHALAHASSCRAQGNRRWRVLGPAPDDEEMCAAVEIQATVVVVTVYWPDEE